MNRIPELLAPAGTPKALSAAIAAGADAVYFGTSSYNARMNAGNFGEEEMRDALRLCRAYGVRTHVTLNTQIFDREIPDVLRCVEKLYRDGVDALIVADIGTARLIHTYFPDLSLHASTQCSGCSARDAEYLASLGFSRMVCARELSAENLRLLVSRSPIEIEMFVHGALCVSVSGQCLFSSLVGGRSGNRGECAQPCRLPYGGGYPLSPKDLCLAGHMREIIDSGAASLKIEGRMKSPDYVYRVTSLYRRLLDEGRDADADDIRALASAFSRSGFTDAYYTGKVKTDPNSMLGVRTEADKDETHATAVEIPSPQKIKLEIISARFRRGAKSELSLTAGGRTVTVTGDVPEEARTQPMTADAVCARLGKLGGTPYEMTDKTAVDIDIEDGLMLPMSAINELRRRGIMALTDPSVRTGHLPHDAIPERERVTVKEPLRTAEFLTPDQITEHAREYFDLLYLPLRSYDSAADGFVMPAVIYDGEEESTSRNIAAAYDAGARAVILSNAGQKKLIRDFDLDITAGFRFNVCNTESASAAHETCADIVTVSPETTARQIEDISKYARTSVIVYGRVPLMVTERCIIRAVSGDKCVCKSAPAALTDRRGVRFPISKGEGCRTVIYNSVPIYMADRGDVLRRMGASAHHYVFTTETARDVDRIIGQYERGENTSLPVRRIK